jgi:hypothetical protein
VASVVASPMVRRAVQRALLIVVAVVFAIEVAIAVSVIGGAGDIGVDYRFYRDAAARWLAGGGFYLPHQLEGPYVPITLVEVLYPPSALFLFVPFTVLPAVLWWLIPSAVMAYLIWSWRPSMWAVILSIVLLMPVRSFGAFLWGNTDMWIAASIAAGLRWGWPAVLIAIKPSVFPFLLVGVRRRSFWVAGAIFAVANLLLWPVWLQYLTVVRNQEIRADYALGSVTLLLIPVVAWLARRRPNASPLPSAPSSPPTQPSPEAH